jgi:hypothetical protein
MLVAAVGTVSCANKHGVLKKYNSRIIKTGFTVQKYRLQHSRFT